MSGLLLSEEVKAFLKSSGCSWADNLEEHLPALHNLLQINMVDMFLKEYRGKSFDPEPTDVAGLAESSIKFQITFSSERQRESYDPQDQSHRALLVLEELANFYRAITAGGFHPGSQDVEALIPHRKDLQHAESILQSLSHTVMKSRWPEAFSQHYYRPTVAG